MNDINIFDAIYGSTITRPKIHSLYISTNIKEITRNCLSLFNLNTIIPVNPLKTQVYVNNNGFYYATEIQITRENNLLLTRLTATYPRDQNPLSKEDEDRGYSNEHFMELEKLKNGLHIIEEDNFYIHIPKIPAFARQLRLTDRYTTQYTYEFTCSDEDMTLNTKVENLSTDSD